MNFLFFIIKVNKKLFNITYLLILFTKFKRVKNNLYIYFLFSNTNILRSFWNIIQHLCRDNESWTTASFCGIHIQIGLTKEASKKN